jgi:hypothetical protein
MQTGQLEANSLAEVYFYLMVTPCPNCGRGPLRAPDAQSPAGDRGEVVVLEAVCRSCKHEARLEFAVPAERLAAARGALGDSIPEINPTDRPSTIIDVAGWVTLFRMVTEAAAKTEDKAECRRLGYEAALCLEEALKFYDDDSELPPDRALFAESSRERYRDNPHLLARSRLINLRAKLPTLDAMQKRLLGLERARKRPWWKIWK